MTYSFSGLIGKFQIMSMISAPRFFVGGYPARLVRRVSMVLVLGSLFLSPWKVAEAQAPTSNLPPKSPMTVRSDIQEANSQTGVVTARGNVQVYYPARKMQATSAQAQYFSRERRLVLTGNVYVLQDGNSMRAETMTYLIDEGRFIATPETQQQVESIYLVTEEQQASPSATAVPQISPLPVIK
jgi:lipopolysaccharide export system protein LptA